MADPKLGVQDILDRAFYRSIAILDVLAVFKSSEIAEEAVEPLADLAREILYDAKDAVEAHFKPGNDAAKAAGAKLVARVKAEQEKKQRKFMAQVKAAAKKAKKRAA